MWKLVIVLGLLPLVVAVVARQVARFRRDARRVDNAPTADALARMMLDGAGASDVRVDQAGPLALPAGPAGPLRLAKEASGNRDSASLGLAVQEVGLCLLERDRGEVAEEVEIRRRVLRFGAGAPAFALLVATFAALAMRAAFGWILAGFVLLVGLACMMNLMTTGIELRAAARGAAELRRLRPPPFHRDDLERIDRAARAAAWRRVVPASLAWLLP